MGMPAAGSASPGPVIGVELLVLLSANAGDPVSPTKPVKGIIYYVATDSLHAGPLFAAAGRSLVATHCHSSSD